MKKILTLVLLAFVSLASFAQKEINAVLKQETRLTARANSNELILKASVQYKGDEESVALQSVKLNLKGTTSISDVKEIKVYTTGLTDYTNGRFMETATLLGSCVPSEGDFDCELEGDLLKGINYLNSFIPLRCWTRLKSLSNVLWRPSIPCWSVRPPNW